MHHQHTYAHAYSNMNADKPACTSACTPTYMLSLVYIFPSLSMDADVYARTRAHSCTWHHCLQHFSCTSTLSHPHFHTFAATSSTSSCSTKPRPNVRQTSSCRRAWTWRWSRWTEMEPPFLRKVWPWPVMLSRLRFSRRIS